MTHAAIEQEAPPGLCWECGYPLKGLPTPRCPECGRAFDPADPATMNLGRHVGGFAGKLLRPPGWPLYTFTLLAALVSVWAAASPMPSGQIASMLNRVWEYSNATNWPLVLAKPGAIEVRYAYAVLAWSLVAAVWIARRIGRGVTVRRIAPGQRAAPLAYWRRWLIPPVVLGATILFCLTPGPVFVGFWASKPSIDAARQNFKGNPLWSLRPSKKNRVKWVGAYPVDDVDGLFSAPQLGPGMNHIVTSDYGGFLYSPDGPPARYTEYDLRYVGGGWYSFHQADVYR
jgi:hypothetical protein